MSSDSAPGTMAVLPVGTHLDTDISPPRKGLCSWESTPPPPPSRIMGDGWISDGDIEPSLVSPSCRGGEVMSSSVQEPPLRLPPSHSPNRRSTIPSPTRPFAAHDDNFDPLENGLVFDVPPVDAEKPFLFAPPAALTPHCTMPHLKPTAPATTSTSTKTGAHLAVSSLPPVRSWEAIPVEEETDDEDPSSDAEEYTEGGFHEMVKEKASVSPRRGTSAAPVEAADSTRPQLVKLLQPECPQAPAAAAKPTTTVEPKLAPLTPFKAIAEPAPEESKVNVSATVDVACQTISDSEVLYAFVQPSILPSIRCYSLLLATRYFGGALPLTLVCLTPFVLPYLAALIGTNVALIYIAILLVSFVQYIYSNVQFWAAHMYPDEKECRNSRDIRVKPFLTRKVELRPHHVLPNREVFSPLVSASEVKRRAFCTVGLSVASYLRDLMSYSLEYKIQAVLRVVALDLGIGRFSRPATREGLYGFVINSSVACFIDPKTGHAVFYDTTLPFGRNGTKLWFRIVLELDHDNQRATKLLMQEENNVRKSNLPPTVLVIEDPGEMCAIIAQVGMLKTHVHVHWFANGVAELTHIWPLADVATDMVQGLNNGSVFSTATPLWTRSTANFGEMLAKNVMTEGLPEHHELSALANNSLSHRISVKARIGLYRAMPQVPKIQIEAILAASVFHSADHWYADEFLPYNSRSEVLQYDFTLSRTTVMAPNKYRTRKLLCREHTDDVICKTLYEAALGVDPRFADEGLFLSVAS